MLLKVENKLFNNNILCFSLLLLFLVVIILLKHASVTYYNLGKKGKEKKKAYFLFSFLNKKQSPNHLIFVKIKTLVLVQLFQMILEFQPVDNCGYKEDNYIDAATTISFFYLVLEILKRPIKTIELIE
jgi:hypothetical protein